MSRMQTKGKIIKWDDSKGFGFIESNTEKQEYFFHISTYEFKGSRPEVGVEVKFIESTDEKGRRHAIKVHPTNKFLKFRPALKSLLIPLLFITTVTMACYWSYLPLVVLYLYLIISVVTFLFYSWDKYCAKHSKQRVAEITLHYLSLFGGWPGALMAQQLIRHKSIKGSFRIKFWLTVFLNLLMLGYLISPYGNWIVLRFI